MELRQLRHFVSVVDTGNLSRAAERVAISQPALTRSIKNLEELLGVELLERKPRGVSPTDAGLALYHHAQVVLNACQRLTREVREFERGVTGMVHIGVAVMFSTDITAQVAENLAQQFPRLAVVVTDAFFEDLIRRMLDGRLDVIFSNFPQFPTSADFVIEPLMTVRSHVVAARAHPLAKRREVARADLVEHRWVIADQPHATDTFEKYFAAEGLPAPRDVFRTNSFSLMRHLVESGRFLSMLPEHVVREQIRTGDIRRLPLPGNVIERQAGLIYRKGAAARPAMQHVLAEYRKVCAQFVSEAQAGS